MRYSPTMPFGKFKGVRLKDIPDDYLEWLYSGPIDLHDWLRDAVEEEIDERNAPPEPAIPAAPLPTFIDRELVHKLIKTGYRNLAKQYHPDHGGTNEDMLRVNLNFEWLEANIDSLLAKAKR